MEMNRNSAKALGTEGSDWHAACIHSPRELWQVTARSPRLTGLLGNISGNILFLEVRRPQKTELKLQSPISWELQMKESRGAPS